MSAVLDGKELSVETVEQPRIQSVMIDGNEAVARVAYATNDVIAIYPITPASPMGEWCDQWAAEQQPNIWNVVPRVVEMQSEAGAVGVVHGALQTGSLATTFTSSQGLLLMIPNMFKIAGELTPAVIHVAARTLATHALSIFCDHSDVMSARSTGFVMLCSSSVQEAHDFALISQAATLRARIPFLHFFDGFRTSHEIANVNLLTKSEIDAMIDNGAVIAHRQRALSPDHPVIRGTAQNPDTFFQARERINPYYDRCAGLIEKTLRQFTQLTGRSYELYEYVGAADAERVIVIMGSGAETAEETVEALRRTGEKVGVLKVRLFRPFDAQRFVGAFPPSVRSIAVLDRTKEPGAADPLYLDCVTAFHEAGGGRWPVIIGGRYGLSSKEFTPAMVAAVFEHLKSPSPRNHFTVGIDDDLTNLSLSYDPAFNVDSPDVVTALFYGYGSDGTVGANKNSIKIIGEKGGLYAQGFFVYDSKKAGTVTVSHLRFGPRPIRSTYLVTSARFLACHHPALIERHEMIDKLARGGVFLLNTPRPVDKVWASLPDHVRKELREKEAKIFVIDASRVAREAGLGTRVNTIMQACFFALSGILPQAEAIEEIKKSIEKTYASKGEQVLARNLRGVDAALANLFEVTVPETDPEAGAVPESPLTTAPKFVRDVLGTMIRGCGDNLPVSALPCDGTFPTATTQFEKRSLAQDIPVWDPASCIQCGKCAMVCPHSAIRIKLYEPEHLKGAPPTFRAVQPMHKEWKELSYTIQVAPEDCTGCQICVDICPAKHKTEEGLKALAMKPQAPLVEEEKKNWDFFLDLPNYDRERLNPGMIRHQQLQQPLFEFSGACAGCGETPYLKLLSQLFGDRILIANATGCSSIYGGNLPTTPWAKNADGRGPAWANSLFEDNAEFGLGFRLSIDQQRELAQALLKQFAPEIGQNLAAAILNATQNTEAEIYEQRERVETLKKRLDQRLQIDRLLRNQANGKAQLLALADLLVKKSVWIVGGDGWAYDIGFGGLDHLFSSGANVNILVLDTEVYSNTGGQMSKATPRTAVAKFAADGKQSRKKDLGLIAMMYGGVYVASIAMGAKDEHTLKAFIEAESYNGPSLIIAYSHCIAHGLDIATAMKNQKAAVDAGQWLLYRYDPRRTGTGETALKLDSKAPSIALSEFMKRENRFRHVLSGDAEASASLKRAEDDVASRWALYQKLAQ